MNNVPESASAIDAQLDGIATRLLDIAGCVASEAETATAVIRGMAEHATRIAVLAAALEAAANDVEAGVRQQAETLAEARTQLVTNKPTIDALAQSVDSVAAISATIAEIARESRMLSLNARIEAARSGGEGSAFAAISAEMSTLTTRTANANAIIGERSMLITRDVQAANKIAVAHAELVTEQDGLLAASFVSAGQQRQIASELVDITADAATTIDTAAAAIGRVGANAVAVKVLARQVSKLARKGNGAC